GAGEADPDRHTQVKALAGVGRDDRRRGDDGGMATRGDYSSSPVRRGSSLSRLDFLSGLRLTSTPPMRATPLMTIVGPPGAPVALAPWSKPPMMPTPVTRVVTSSGTVISMPAMIATT